MNSYVLDTDILSLWQHNHSEVCKQVAAHTPEELAVTVITVQEQLDGWNACLPRAKERKQIADLYNRLSETVRFLSRLVILSFSEAAIERFEKLKKQKLNIGKMDLRIAAIVLQEGGILVTRNIRDFSRIPDLLLKDWFA